MSSSMSSSGDMLLGRRSGEAQDVLDDGKDRPHVDVLHIGCVSGLDLLVEGALVGREEAALPGHRVAATGQARPQGEGLGGDVIKFVARPQTVIRHGSVGPVVSHRIMHPVIDQRGESGCSSTQSRGGFGALREFLTGQRGVLGGCRHKIAARHCEMKGRERMCECVL